MDSTEEIKQILAEIRDMQREHFEKWNKIYERDVERQKAAEQTFKRASRGSKIWGLFFLGCVLAILFFPYLRSVISDRTGVRNRSFLTAGKHYEAKEWLEKNQSESGFVSNRFESTKKALEFVKLLYDAGAQAVYVIKVDDSPDRIKNEKGPYADTLIVVLPEDKTRRSEIFKIHATESESEGYDAERDKGQKELLFWWD